VPGTIDYIDCGVISGWAYDLANPAARLYVEVSIGDRKIATAEACQFRQDLLDADHGDGRSGFGIVLTEADWRALLEKRKEVQISARVPETGAAVHLHISDRADAFLNEENWRRSFLSEPAPVNVQLAVLCIIKDEAHCVEEWISYHLVRGAQFFLFYDNGSCDNLREVLDPYINSGLAKIIVWPNFVSHPVARARTWHEQVMAYAHGMRVLQGFAEWVAVLDVDEFIVSRSHASIPAILDQIHAEDVVTLYWRFYGSSGHETSPQGLVIENFTRRERDGLKTSGMPFKFIVRPDRIGWLINTHLPVLECDEAVGMTSEGSRFWTSQGGLANANFTTLWINHYHTKSRDDYKRKVIRGWPANTDTKNVNWDQFFTLHDVNDVADPILVEYAPAVREMAAGIRTGSAETQHNAYNGLIVKFLISECDELVKVSGMACDLAKPGVRVAIRLANIYGALVHDSICDLPHEPLRSLDFHDINYGFSVSAARSRFPFGQVRLVLNGTTFIRSLPDADRL
jgi:hypothetical protein